MTKFTTKGTARHSVLNNGIHVLTDSVPSMHTVALGVWINAASRNEDPAVNGAAHMVEHMMFKGTKTRSAGDIVEQIENVGGSMNAYTSREMTNYYVHLLKDDTELALNVIGDMVLNSTLPDEEVERERDVILQEIGMCTDTPDDLVYDNYFSTAWQNQKFGAPILGTSEIISSMSCDALKNFIDTYYVSGNIVVAAAGHVDHEHFVSLVDKIFGSLPKKAETKHEKAEYTGGLSLVEKELEQSHIILGFKAPSRHDDGYLASRVLATVLGGGMSSRLFQEIREKRGLVYSVYAFSANHSDTGSFGIYAGTGPDKLPELMPVVCEEILKIGQDLTEEELKRAKARLKAGLLRGRESMVRRADGMAKYFIYHKSLYDPDEIINKIDALSLVNIKSLARDIFASPPTLSALGPLEKLASFDDIKSMLSH